jgi:antitoxin (DNA-binding transcriptional repressor) of toxin-antitoxin stability system
MKTVSIREFYHNAGLVDGLPQGQQLVVTANGKPKFVVSKSRRPKMTRKLAEARAVGSIGASKFNGTAFLGSLKKLGCMRILRGGWVTSAGATPSTRPL